MQAVRLREYVDGKMSGGYVWHHCGDGGLDPISYVRADWWIVCGGRSWCSCPSDIVYIFDSEAEKSDELARMKAGLAESRNRYPLVI